MIDKKKEIIPLYYKGAEGLNSEFDQFLFHGVQAFV
jgi:hypothetical protein